MKPRIFEHFPKDSICPVCGNNTDNECVLLSIDGTDEDDGKICQAIPVHADCLRDLKFRYNKEANIIYRVCAENAKS